MADPGVVPDKRPAPTLDYTCAWHYHIEQLKLRTRYHYQSGAKCGGDVSLCSGRTRGEAVSTVNEREISQDHVYSLKDV